MVKLEWLETFEIGHEVIDRDHRRILALMRQTKDAIEGGDLDKCAELLGEMLTTASSHFEHEESVLAEANYPQLDTHKKYHQELLERAKHVKGICEGLRGESDDLQGCFDEMASFIVDDIVKGDLTFVSYLQDMGVIERQ